MKAQILRHTGDPEVDSQVRFVRRHSLQFGDGKLFASYIEKHCSALSCRFDYRGTLEIYKKGPSPSWSAECLEAPLAVWIESPEWSNDGRLIYLNGQLVCSIKSYIRPDSSLSHADVDGLARKIVDLLNEKGVEL